MKLYGVIKAGKIDYYDEATLSAWLEKNEGKEIKVDFGRRSKKDRSIDQNAYYWGVLVKEVVDFTGEETEDIHEFYKKEFLAYDGLFITKFKSTTDLDTGEFNEFCRKIRNWAWHFLTLHLPEPNEDPNLPLYVG